MAALFISHGVAEAAEHDYSVAVGSSAAILCLEFPALG